jgi:Neisseria PilC beta-propeller domain
MFKLNKSQTTILIGLSCLLGTIGLLAYAAVIFAPNKQPIGYVGQPTMSNLDVSSGNEKTYRGEYVSSDWSGRFDCYPVGVNGYVNLASPCFTAGAGSPLDVQAAAGTRKIGTRSDSASAPGVEFSTTGLTATQQGAAGMVTAANIDFIRGVSLTPAGLRARTTVLGDIIHSRPYYYTDGVSPTVFVGANDGMLHAFDAANGQERWAYIPSMLLPRLPALSSPSYISAHEYYVDGSMAIGKAGTTTVLVGALGAGGKGLYALDISTLTAASGAAAGAKGLWEITNTTLKTPTNFATHSTASEYRNLGDTYSNPKIAPTQDGSDAVIVGNGYNNTGDGCAYLYVINAANGSLIRAIKASVGACSAASPQGLSSTTVIDSDGDGKKDRVYAGDIDGNMWMFDLSSQSPASWTATNMYSTGQAITQAPVIGVHPVKGFMVNFTTGRMLSDTGAATISPSTLAASNDPADIATVYGAYGVWDNMSTNTISAAEMITQTIDTRSYQPTSVINAATAIAVRMLTTDLKPNWATHRGWKAMFPVAGERVVGDGAYLLGGKFQFNISNPTISYSSSAKGENWLMGLDYLTGGAGYSPFYNLDRLGGIDAMDRIKYLSTDTLPAGATIGQPNLAASGIPVAYATSNGVQSQPILIQLGQASVPLYNQNFNAKGAGAPSNDTGVNGGHFDVDMFMNTGGTVTTPAACTGGTLNIAGTACQGTCTGGTLDPSGTRCAISTPASCTGGTLNNAGTACATVAASCPGGTLNNAGTACATVAASCNGGTLNAAKTACTTGPVCTGGALNPAKTACTTVPVCTGGALNAAKTACTKVNGTTVGTFATNATIGVYSASVVIGTYVPPTTPGTYVPPTTPGTYVPATTPGTFVPVSTPGTYSALVRAGTYVAPVGTFTAAVQVQGAAAPNYSKNDTLGNSTHNHEYDKAYDTNGLNMLNPNDTQLKLSAAVTTNTTTTTTEYKVLLMNQSWNRAMSVKIGKDEFSTKDYQTGPNSVPRTGTYVAANASVLNGVGYLDVANLPKFTGNASTVTTSSAVAAGSTTAVVGKVTVLTVTTVGSIGCGGVNADGSAVIAGSGCTSTTSTTGKRELVGGLEMSMPNDGFDIKDWWGDNVIQTGVMPTSPNCPDGSVAADGTEDAGGTNQIGPLGERNDGVLTVQIIRATTPNNHVQLNVPGQPKYGFRVMDAYIITDVLAEYILYWHHPNGLCYGDTSTAWSALNRNNDAWWPALTANSTASTSGSTTRGILTCSTKVKDGSPANATWLTTAPSGWAGGAAGAWPPAGFSMSPQQDGAKTLPPCPIYSATADDPRTASFIDSNVGTGNNGTGTNGTNGTGTNGNTGAVAAGTNLMGGTSSNAAAGTGVGGTTTTTTGTSGVVATTTSTQNPPVTSSRRITWRELIGL